MRSEITTIITGTYNKDEFLPDAADSILAQTSPDWRWWIVLDDAEEATKEVAYNLAKLDNRITCFEEKMESKQHDPYAFNREAIIRDAYFSRVGTKYLSWLSDDDVLEPCFVEVLVNKIKEKQGHVAFGFADVLIQQNYKWEVKRRHCPDSDLGLGQRVQPFTNIDGGQFLQTKESFEAINWKFNNNLTPSLIDAIYMNELAKHFVFYQVPVKVYTKRITYLSTYEKGSNRVADIIHL